MISPSKCSPSNSEVADSISKASCNLAISCNSFWSTHSLAVDLDNNFGLSCRSVCSEQNQAECARHSTCLQRDSQGPGILGSNWSIITNRWCAKFDPRQRSVWHSKVRRVGSRGWLMRFPKIGASEKWRITSPTINSSFGFSAIVVVQHLRNTSLRIIR